MKPKELKELIQYLDNFVKIDPENKIVNIGKTRKRQKNQEKCFIMYQIGQINIHRTPK